MVFSICSAESHIGQSEESGEENMISIFTWGRASPDSQHRSTRLSQDYQVCVAFEPLRRADLCQHDGFSCQKRRIPAPLYAYGARTSQLLLVTVAALDDGSWAAFSDAADVAQDVVHDVTSNAMHALRHATADFRQGLGLCLNAKGRPRIALWDARERFKISAAAQLPECLKLIISKPRCQIFGHVSHTDKQKEL